MSAVVEIENLVKSRPGGSREIKEVLDSLDELCGIG